MSRSDSSLSSSDTAIAGSSLSLQHMICFGLSLPASGAASPDPFLPVLGVTNLGFTLFLRGAALPWFWTFDVWKCGIGFLVVPA